MGTYSKLCEWCCLCQQIAPLAKSAGIAAKRRKGCSPLFGTEWRKTAQTSIVRAVCLEERTYRACPCIEVRPCLKAKGLSFARCSRFLQFSISIWNSPYFSFGIWKDRLPTVGGLNIETDFHRIYGVIFCALLHREATEYLLFVGTTMVCFRDNDCSHIVVWAYDHLIRSQAQAHDSDA